ncbi:MAG: aminopeptidase [Clostridiales bacterium]|nr:aminopeptidase [Clostridiales bacterium]
MDPRIKTLAHLLVHYSCRLEEGEKILIDFEGSEVTPLIRQIIKEVYLAGGQPFVYERNSTILRELLFGATEQQLQLDADNKLALMKQMDAYIAVRGADNLTELADVPHEKMNLYNRIMTPVTDERVNNSKWVVLRYPNNAMAQMANMSREAFEDFYYDVCTLDYSKMDKAMDALKDLMEHTDKVRLVAPGTDLTFSIKGIPAIKCAGECNIPDGEVYTAPVRESMNGTIAYNTPSLEDGFTYENIVFEVKDGKIVKATANDNERINAMLDTDEGARYFGEFAIGVNPYVLEPMKDILFDEKICGSFHLTPGMCYDDAPNGNKSAVHWDLVQIQRPEYGGGEIWFDDVLIRKDGLFVIDELLPLNPENLK